MLVDAGVRVAPVAGMAILHELCDGVRLVRTGDVEWDGTLEYSEPIVIRHEVGKVRGRLTRPVLAVPPWCTFELDEHREPAARFHPVFGEVERLLRTEVPGFRYVVRYETTPSEPAIALQSELTAYSFALSARGTGLIAHACAFVLPDVGGVLCPGMSGAGKTTLARLLQRTEAGATLLTDDRAIVTVNDGHTPFVWGSAWPGAAQIAGTGSAPLGAVMFLGHGDSVSIRSVTPGEAFRRIVNTLSMPLWEPERCARALEIVDAIVSQSRLLEATYPPTTDAALRLADQLRIGSR